jgi:hypothetical protein
MTFATLGNNHPIKRSVTVAWNLNVASPNEVRIFFVKPLGNWNFQTFGSFHNQMSSSSLRDLFNAASGFALKIVILFS